MNKKIVSLVLTSVIFTTPVIAMNVEIQTLSKPTGFMGSLKNSIARFTPTFAKNSFDRCKTVFNKKSKMWTGVAIVTTFAVAYFFYNWLQEQKKIQQKIKDLESQLFQLTIKRFETAESKDDFDAAVKDSIEKEGLDTKYPIQYVNKFVSKDRQNA